MLSLFMAGAVGSLSHCTGMCGPFVLSIASCGNGHGPTLQRTKGLELLPYHFGRITTYAFLGALATIVTTHLTGLLKVSLLPVVFLTLGGVLFLLQFFGIEMLAVNLPSLPRFMEKTVTGLSQYPLGVNGYFLGTILGFLPCGLLFSALLIAASAPSPLFGALGMLLFGLATVPALQLVAFLGKHVFSRKPQWVYLFRKGLNLASAVTLFILAGVRLI